MNDLNRIKTIVPEKRPTNKLLSPKQYVKYSTINIYKRVQTQISMIWQI